MKNSLTHPLIYFVTLLFGIIIAGTASGSSQERPNIVFIISDDDNYQNFGFMGSGLSYTPTLDRLAESGTVFTTAHVPSPLCRPSLASMLSGKLPQQHGIYSNYMQEAKIGADTRKLDPRGSLPNKLKSAGYSTFATAKYWEGDPREMGFTHGSADATMGNFRKFVREGQQELWDFIDSEHEDNPMFIWWAPLIPHTPHNPPEKYKERFKDAEIPIPSYVTENKDEYVESVRTFYGMGAWFDDGVSELVAKLKAADEFENTLFVFYVDNGYAFGMPGKNSPWEMGLRTPLFLSWPGQVPADKRIDGLTYALDLHATMLDYAGVEPATKIESRSLRPLIDGKTNKTRDQLFGATYAHHAHNHPEADTLPIGPERDVFTLYARDKKWKYMLFTQDVGEHNVPYFYLRSNTGQVPTASKGEERLYDLEHDPFETNNLINQPGHRTRAAKLRRQLFDWWERTGGKPIDGIQP